MAYDREGIMAQLLIAFGQGTGAIRVSQRAALTLKDLYQDAITDEVVGIWGEEAVQVLERIRAIGRLAAFEAAQRGDTSVKADDVAAAARTVQATSATPLCPPAEGKPAIPVSRRGRSEEMPA